MKKIDLGSYVVLLVLGVVVSYQSLQLSVGTWMVPGPGFLPFGAGISLSLISLGLLVPALMRKQATLQGVDKFWPDRESRKNVSLILLSLIAYNLLWTKLGFSLSTLLLMGFLFRIVGKQSWRVALGGAVLTSAAAYVLFGLLLQGQLPTGITGF